MANMIPISTVTVGSGGAASISFTNIPQTYTDLLIKISARSARSAIDDDLFISFNESTSSYSYRYLRGYSTNVNSSSGSNQYAAIMPAASVTASTFGNAELYIPNYTSSNNKSLSSDSVVENNSSTAYEAFDMFIASLWSNTSPISSIKLTSGTSNNFAQYSSATLYGIRKY